MFLTRAYGIVAIHDIPCNMPKRAITRIKMPSMQRGWVSLVYSACHLAIFVLFEFALGLRGIRTCYPRGARRIRAPQSDRGNCPDPEVPSTDKLCSITNTYCFEIPESYTLINGSGTGQILDLDPVARLFAASRIVVSPVDGLVELFGIAGFRGPASKGQPGSCFIHSRLGKTSNRKRVSSNGFAIQVYL